MKIKFVTIVAIALAMGFASCNNDDEVINGGNELQGERTAMQITIKTPRSPKTYALVDGNATDAEIKLKTVNVLIYNKNGNGSYTLESNTPRNAGDFTLVSGTADTYQLNAGSEITTTTGDKRIFVAVNYTGPYPAANDPESGLYELVRTGMTANELSTPVGTTTTEAGFAQFSTKVEEKSLVADATLNKVMITTRRMVAKMTVTEGATLRTAGVIKSEGGVLSDPQFAVGNINTSIYPFQKVVGTLVQDNNWDVWATGDLIGISDYSVGSGEYQALNPAGTTDINLMNVAYAPENTNKVHKTDGSNLTYISVRAQYVPAFIANPDGSEKFVPTTPQTFYVVVNTDGSVMYFENTTDATGYVDLHQGAVMTTEPYTNGLCYFRAYLNSGATAYPTIDPSITANPFDVLRNQFYKTTIKSIKAPGSPTDQGDVTEKTSMDLDIDIDPWEPIDDEIDL